MSVATVILRVGRDIENGGLFEVAKKHSSSCSTQQMHHNYEEKITN